MKLQTKISLVMLPLVGGAILLTGAWAWYQAERAVRNAISAHLESVLESYVHNHLEMPYRTLVNNNMNQVDSVVASYQRRAEKAASLVLKGRDGHLFAVDGHGRLAFCGLDHPKGMMSQHMGQVALALAREGDGNMRMGLVSSDRGNELYAARYFKPWDLVVFLSVPERQIYAGLANMRIGVFSLAGLCALFSMVVLNFVLRRVFVRPVGRLEDVAARIAKRQPVGDIGLQSRDELGSLARSMESMANAIGEYEAKQVAWQQDLEERVRTRTEELRQSNLALLSEVDQRKKASRELRWERDRARAYFETAQGIFVVLDDEGRVESINRKGCQALGYEPQELVGRNWLDECVPPEDRDYVRKVFRQIVEACLELTEYVENQVLTKSGGRLTVSWHNALLADESGAVTGIISAGRDVTEARQMENAHRQAQKLEAIGTLAGGIAHDFNNILGAIYGYTEIAIDEMETGGNPGHDLRQVLAGCNRAKELVRQILTFSRREDKEMHPVRLSSIVKEALKLLRASLPATIEIRQDIAGEEYTVMAEPSQMHQVMMNLCTNAAHAMGPDGGKLTVKLGRRSINGGRMRVPELEPGEYLVLSVGDTGHGMTPQVMERIFEPFFTTKQRGEGTGMGLATTHGIIKGHGGAITVRSVPGQGTIFDVLLPAIRGGQESEPVDTAPVPAGDEHVLFVDDEESLVSVAERMLSRLGYRVTSFSRGDGALEALRQSPGGFDLLITDLTMPKLSGLDLARKARDVNPDLPVIICTGYGFVDLPERAREAGVSEIVHKPLLRRELAEAIRRALDGGKAS